MDFFKRAQQEPFRWGQNDCALWVASYVYEQTGVDPAKILRGRYKTALGCHRLLKKEGGLLAVSKRLMSEFKLGEDIGVFELNGVEIAGIQKGDFTAFKTPHGLYLEKEARLICGWSI
tara:strand:- start:187 stop:540 length:354 start_codon:yes stop_codon:yes gene_type:complete